MPSGLRSWGCQCRGRRATPIENAGIEMTKIRSPMANCVLPVAVLSVITRRVVGVANEPPDCPAELAPAERAVAVRSWAVVRL